MKRSVLLLTMVLVGVLVCGMWSPLNVDSAWARPTCGECE